jgi:hypothetical protein
MDLQYISDADGRQTAVVIPIEDWKDLTVKHEILRDLDDKSQKTKTMASFRGIITDKEADELQEFVRKSREEWS